MMELEVVSSQDGGCEAGGSRRETRGEEERQRKHAI
jgi:hypothetical protein